MDNNMNYFSQVEEAVRQRKIVSILPEGELDMTKVVSPIASEATHLFTVDRLGFRWGNRSQVKLAWNKNPQATNDLAMMVMLIVQGSGLDVPYRGQNGEWRIRHNSLGIWTANTWGEASFFQAKKLCNLSEGVVAPEGFWEFSKLNSWDPKREFEILFKLTLDQDGLMRNALGTEAAKRMAKSVYGACQAPPKPRDGEEPPIKGIEPLVGQFYPKQPEKTSLFLAIGIIPVWFRKGRKFAPEGVPKSFTLEIHKALGLSLWHLNRANPGRMMLGKGTPTPVQTPREAQKVLSTAEETFKAIQTLRGEEAGI